MYVRTQYGLCYLCRPLSGGEGNREPQPWSLGGLAFDVIVLVCIKLFKRERERLRERERERVCVGERERKKERRIENFLIGGSHSKFTHKDLRTTLISSFK